VAGGRRAGSLAYPHCGERAARSPPRTIRRASVAPHHGDRVALVTIPFAALRAFRSPNVFNPWAERDPLDIAHAARTGALGPAGRLSRLEAHFAATPTLVLLGEASGYQGCHFSGMPFTNEKLLLEGRIPRVDVAARLTTRLRPWCEPSATVVWGTLHALGLAERTVLWNAFAWHPFKPGMPYSNRAPTRDELEAGRDVLDGVLTAFACAKVVAVGKVAERTLRGLGREPDATVRHPSMGGANEFRAGLAALATRLGLGAAPSGRTTRAPSTRRAGSRRR
jgi:uracil-DNA glycosylase